MRARRGWIGVVLPVCLAGCGTGQDRKAAEAVAGKFHAALLAKHYDQAAALGHPDLFQQISKADFIKILEMLPEKLRAYQSNRLVGSNIRK